MEFRSLYEKAELFLMLFVNTPAAWLKFFSSRFDLQQRGSLFSIWMRYMSHAVIDGFTLTGSKLFDKGWIFSDKQSNTQLGKLSVCGAEGYLDLGWTLYTAQSHTSRTVDTDRDSEKGKSQSSLKFSQSPSYINNHIVLGLASFVKCCTLHYSIDKVALFLNKKAWRLIFKVLLHNGMQVFVTRFSRWINLLKLTVS